MARPSSRLLPDHRRAARPFERGPCSRPAPDCTPCDVRWPCQHCRPRCKTTLPAPRLAQSAAVPPPSARQHPSRATDLWRPAHHPSPRQWACTYRLSTPAGGPAMADAPPPGKGQAPAASSSATPLPQRHQAALESLLGTMLGSGPGQAALSSLAGSGGAGECRWFLGNKRFLFSGDKASRQAATLPRPASARSAPELPAFSQPCLTADALPHASSDRCRRGPPHARPARPERLHPAPCAACRHQRHVRCVLRCAALCAVLRRAALVF